MDFSNCTELCHAVEVTKEELLTTYKNKGGIYFLLNEVKNKGYVGKAVIFSVRYNDYATMTAERLSKIKGTSYIYNSVVKHGFDKFRFFILEVVDDPHNDHLLRSKECYYIDISGVLHRAYGYNLRDERYYNFNKPYITSGSNIIMVIHTHGISVCKSFESAAKLGNITRGILTYRLKCKNTPVVLNNTIFILVDKLESNRGGAYNINNKTCVPVILYKDGVVDSMFTSVKAAGITKNINKGDISSVIHYRRKTVGGYTARPLTDIEKKLNNINF